MLHIEKGQDINQELLKKYKSVVPYELTKIWEDFGFCRLVGGYLKVINPEDYQELLNETYF
ncbi:GAD-like domain-containing protein, partial [Pseudobutyrivibrio ruminis]